MMDMVERVARSMWAERRRDAMEHGIYLEEWDEGAPATGAVANNIMGEARAAIEAMREPNEVMGKAGGAVHSGNDYFSPEDFPDEATKIFVAMIDAALPHQSEGE